MKQQSNTWNSGKGPNTFLVHTPRHLHPSPRHLHPPPHAAAAAAAARMVCPTAAAQAAISRLGASGEGTAGKFNLQIRYIRAVAAPAAGSGH